MVEYTSAYGRPKSTQQPAEPIQGGTSMIKHKSLSRRRLLKGAGAAGAMTITGFPAISYAQADVIRIGHLTPRTGFLGPARRVCRSGRRPRGRGDQRRRRRHGPQDRSPQGGLGQSADGLDQGRAHDRARQGRLHRRRDLVRLGPRRSPRSRSAPRRSSSTRAATRTSCAARAARSSCSTSSAQNSMYVKTGRPLASARRAWSRARSGTR